MSQSGLTHELGHPVSVELPRIPVTKTKPPAVRKFAVERPRLLDVLDAASERRLILFKASAGYGKTTLAVEWCQRLREAGAIVAWLSLDADDDEPGAFAYNVVRAVEVAAPNLTREAVELLQAASLIPAHNVVASLLNAVSEIDSDLYLFFDDFHLITDVRCHDLIRSVLRYAPSNLHLVLVSRIEPPFPLSQVRLDDEILEINATLLSFSLEETRLFLGEALASRLGQTGVEKLHAASEGWPAALQLARIALVKLPDGASYMRGFSGTTRTISEYFEYTLASEPAAVVDFLLQTSILDEMTGSLCSAVAGTPDGSSMLHRLEREQFLLVPLDEVGGWYRYHHLLREYLTDRLNAQRAGQIAELNRRAYRWFAKQALWTTAVQHALAAGDFTEALEFVENCAMSLVVKGDLLTLLKWEQKLPAELMRGQLEVKLALAWGMALVTRFKEAEELLAQVEAGTFENARSDLWWRCRVARSVLCALLDDSSRGKDIALECLGGGHKFDPFHFNALCNIARYDYLKSGDWSAFYAVSKPDPLAGEASYVLPENYRLCLYGLAAAQQLKFDEAQECYVAAKALAEKYVGAKSVSASMVTGLMARLRYERGDVVGAEVAVLDALDLIETTAFHESFYHAYFVLVRAAAIRGDSARAIALLNRAQSVCWARGWGAKQAALLVEHTRVLLSQGNIGGARELLGAYDELEVKHPAGTSSNPLICTHRMASNGLIAAAAGDAQEAGVSLAGAFDKLLAVDDRLSALRIGIDLVILHADSGSSERAYELIRQLIDWGANANIASFVLDHDRRIVPILTHAHKTGAFGGELKAGRFVTDLLTRLRERSSTTRKSTPSRPRDELTDRERSIVAFIAAGRSNKEIARELGVAPETIKTHVKRIFHKLSAESRAQAVVRAQSFGLLKNTEIRPTL